MRVVAAVALMGLSACSLLVSTSDLSGGDGATNDPDGADGAPTSGDGGTLPDGARADAAPSGDAGSSPCGSAHLFCDDFDTGGSSLMGRWSSFTQNAGPLVLDTSSFASPPRALRVSVGPGNGNRVSELRKNLKPMSPKLRVDFDVFSNGPATSSFGEIDPVEISMYPAPMGFKNHGLSVVVYPTKTVLQYYETTAISGMGNVIESEVTAPLGRWVHVTLDVDFTSQPGTAVIAFDGVASAPLKLDGTTMTGADIALGATYTESVNTDFSALFDNVVAD